MSGSFQRPDDLAAPPAVDPRLPPERARTCFERALASPGPTAGALRRHPELLDELNRRLAGREAVGLFARHAVAVVLRVVELAGGRCRRLGAADLAEADARLRPLRVALEPLDDGFPARARALERPLPHLLDLVLDGLFVGPDVPRASVGDRAEIHLFAWRAALAVDRAWDGPPSVPFATQEPTP